MRVWILFLVVIMMSGALYASPTLARFALVMGSNDGGEKRETLKYAHSDARSVASVLQEMGGVDDENLFVLLEPAPEGVDEILDEMALKLNQLGPETRKEVFLYYSGHADAKGLLLGARNYSFKKLRERIDGLPAEVRITILDACESGAILRAKGGRIRKPFLLDESSKTKGYAFLTSSAGDEISQESDRVGGSFFTYALVGGMRGAADVSGDKKVTLNEAYQYAFHETLDYTARARGGSQHPNYEMGLTGSGDVVVTDLRQTSATLYLDRMASGRVFIRDAQRRLVAEMNKQPGRVVEIGLAPGEYIVEVEDDNSLRATKITLREGRKGVVGSQDLVAQKRSFSLARGGTHYAANDSAAYKKEEQQSQEIETNHGVRVAHDSATAATLGDRVNPEPAWIFDCPEGEDRFDIGTLMIFSDYPGDLCGFQFVFFLGNIDGGLKGSQISIIQASARGNISGFQFGGFGAYGAQGIKGFQLGGLAGVARESVVGAQLSGVGNYIGGNVRGVQLSGVASYTKGSLTGVQLSAVSIVGEDATGVQGGGALAYVGGDFTGAQFGSAVNYIQGKTKGFQGGIVNVSGSIHGAQVGHVNVADTLRGAQIGVVNVADYATGAMIGLINISGNGVLSAVTRFDETGMLMGGFRSGTPTFFTTLWAGRHRDFHSDIVGGGLDFGWRKRLEDYNIHLDIGIGSVLVLDGSRGAINNLDEFWESSNFLNTLRTGFGVVLWEHISLNMYGTLNQLVHFKNGHRLLKPVGGPWTEDDVELIYHEPTVDAEPDTVHGTGYFWPGLAVELEVGRI